MGKCEIPELTLEERRALSIKIGNKTREEALNLLRKYGRCLVTRPTGVGKTYLLCKIAEEYYLPTFSDKVVIYVYPNEIITNEIRNNSEYKAINGMLEEEAELKAIKKGKPYTREKGLCDRLIFLSYQKIAQSFSETGRGKSKEAIMELVKNCSCILVDEVHRSAANGFKNFYNEIQQYIGADKTHILGVTATIERTVQAETDWIVSELFQNIRVSKFDLDDAILSGLLPKPIYSKPVLNPSQMAEEAKRLSKAIGTKDEAVVNRLIDGIRFELGKSEYNLLEALQEDYNLASKNSDKSYLKFIVFFSDTRAMVEQGVEVEEFFHRALNSVATEFYNKPIKTTMTVEYVISSTADIANDNIVEKHCEQKKYRIYRNKPDEVGTTVKYISKPKWERGSDGKYHVKQNSDGSVCMEGCKTRKQIEPKANHIDLIFNVGTIVMGYHVPNTSGVVQMASVNSNIPYFQQIGRCFSVKATKRPIILDMALNIEKNFLIKESSSKKGMTYTTSEGMSTKDNAGLIDIVDFKTDACDMFLAKLNAIVYEDYELVEKINYLYSNRKMPVSLIASNLGISCSKVLTSLMKSSCKLQKEIGELEYIVNRWKVSSPEEKKYYVNRMRYLLDKEADKQWKRLKNDDRLKISLYDKFKELAKEEGYL